MTSNRAPYPLILASTSVFRKMLLERLQLPFITFAPEVDETPLAQETAADLVQRLAVLKAGAATNAYPRAIVIGSDQVAHCQGEILGKPRTHDCAVEQLRFISGRTVEFLTGLCVLNTETQQTQVKLVTVEVQYRHLTETQIENYLQREHAYSCAASFRSEGLGSALVERMTGDDPAALIGLPLIPLVQMLEQQGLYAI